MQYSRVYRKLKGFTLIESMLGLMVIGLVSGSIMLGITTVEKKLFKIRLKEHAFEILRNYTNFLGSRIVAGNMPDNIVDSGKDVVIYKHEDKNNIVTEATHSNVWIIKNNTIYTHPSNSDILKGITRKVIKKIIKDEKLLFKEKSFTLKQLINADEVFITSSGSLVTPIIQVDNKKINSGKIGKLTNKLAQLYEQQIQ